MLHVLVTSLVEHPWNRIRLWLPQKEKRWYAKEAWPKKNRERERGSHVSKKKKKKERDRDVSREKTNALRSKPHLSIHLSIHPLIHLHLLIEIAWLVSPWILSLILQYMECTYAMFLSYLELHKGFLAVGEIEGRYCPGEDNKSWVPRESHHRNFVMFSKIFQKVSPDGLQIYEQVSTTLCTILTLDSPRQGDS